VTSLGAAVAAAAPAPASRAGGPLREIAVYRKVSAVSDSTRDSLSGLRT
jgi:hypothetical protein